MIATPGCHDHESGVRHRCEPPPVNGGDGGNGCTTEQRRNGVLCWPLPRPPRLRVIPWLSPRPPRLRVIPWPLPRSPCLDTTIHRRCTAPVNGGDGGNGCTTEQRSSGEADVLCRSVSLCDPAFARGLRRASPVGLPSPGWGARPVDLPSPEAPAGGAPSKTACRRAARPRRIRRKRVHNEAAEKRSSLLLSSSV